jgi:hypothetical protein
MNYALRALAARWLELHEEIKVHTRAVLVLAILVGVGSSMSTHSLDTPTTTILRISK